MSTLPVVDSNASFSGSRSTSVRSLVWTPLLNGDSGIASSVVGTADRSVQVNGTFGAGGTLLIEGTNDGTNWYTLTDPLGTALSFAAAGLRQISELTGQIRPRVSAGDGTTSLTCTIICRALT